MWNTEAVADDWTTPSLPGDCEPLNERNFRRICDVIQRSCGIHITAKKKSLVEGRMRRRMRAHGFSNPNAYCHLLLEADPQGDELALFIDAVTTNKTDFFREPKHFEFLRDVALPRFSETGRHPLKLWSAACSTGAEAYTMAMVCDAYFGNASNYSILATDICSDVLEKGVTALYPDTMLEPVPEAFRRRYVLVAKNPDRHEFRIAPQLRHRVDFRRLNLMDDAYPFESDFDVIFLRNVLIYFDRATQKAVLSKLVEHLRPGGYLLLGHSETLAGTGLPLEQVASTIFVRR
jgi:chemotaxis methyl-accepting protein methylase